MYAMLRVAFHITACSGTQAWDIPMLGLSSDIKVHSFTSYNARKLADFALFDHQKQTKKQKKNLDKNNANHNTYVSFPQFLWTLMSGTEVGLKEQYAK